MAAGTNVAVARRDDAARTMGPPNKARGRKVLAWWLSGCVYVICRTRNSNGQNDDVTIATLETNNELGDLFGRVFARWQAGRYTVRFVKMP